MFAKRIRLLEGEMPVVAAHIDLKIFKKISRLVDSGAYENPEQFLQVAAYNQLALEKQANRPTTSPPTKPEKATQARPKKKSKPTKSRRVAIPSKRATASERTVSDEDVQIVLAQLQRPSGARWLGPKPLPPLVRESDEYLWGQINRLLPLKIACRWLAVHAVSSGHWSSYDRVADRLADSVASLGTALAEVDNVECRKRDQVISTALPRKNNPSSRTRYVSQFLVRATRNGDLHPGAIVQYGLARTGETNDREIALTDLGVSFARLENPVLDGKWQSATRGISEAEARHIVESVLQYVPGESEAIQEVTSGIVAGANTPTALAERLRPSLPDGWTEAALRTHIAGLIGRMVDMRLVERRWEGRHAFYELGPLTSLIDAADLAAAG